jgi:hypothetical protein
MPTDPISPNAIVIACDPSAVPADQRDQWVATGTQVYAAVQAVHDLPNGYRFRLPAESAMLLKVAEYISNERLCCTFLHFAVEIEPQRGPIWLELTGGSGVKEYMWSVLETNHLLDENVARLHHPA